MFSSEIKESIFKVLKSLGIPVAEEEISLEHPADLAHGDYSTNIALVLTKKEKKNPRELAEEIVKKWQERGLPDFVEKIDVARPGFINIWLKFEALSRQLAEVLKEGDEYGRRLKSATTGRNVIANFSSRLKTMVIDYSAPNIAKPFGIGHLRSTNIGQAIYNLYRFLGWKVIGDNHLGDWGTQFGKLIFQIVRHLKNHPEPVEGSSLILGGIPPCTPFSRNDRKEILANLTISDLEKLYVEFHKEAETKPEMEKEARKWFKKLEDGDPEAKEIWQACVDISLKEFDRIYDLLGVKIDYAYGESFYQDKMNEILEDCRRKGILRESEGAQVIELPGMEIPAMLVKSDGATTYLLRDLATVKYRVKTWRPDLIVYEVGADQTLHFKQLFKICELLEYGNLKMFVHIAHGLIRWPKGKFSTRKGMTIHLEKVLNEAIRRAKLLSQEPRHSLISRTKDIAIASEFVRNEEEIAEKVGIGAIKYNDLKQNPRTDIIFDWNQILTLSGNSGPYLQYTFARIQSVLKKAKFSIFNSQFSDNIKFQNFQFSNEEIALLRTIYKFPEAVEEAAREFSPNLLCNFLFDLSQKFNLFYDKQRIIGSENEEFRLGLTAAAGQVLKNGLNLLGIEALERM